MARQFAGSKLIGCDRDFIADVQLVVSELVTNAYEAICRALVNPELHGTIDLTVTCAPRWVHLCVQDLISDEMPVRRPASDTAVHGRGLAIVDELASLWWLHEYPQGKAVHAVLAMPDAVLTIDDVERIVSGL